MSNFLVVTGREHVVGRVKARHGSEGRVEIAMMDVADPVTGKTRTAVINMRESGVGHLHTRGVVTDQQKAAADRFRELYERAIISGLKGIDYSRIIVDCSSAQGDVMSEGMMKAAQELARIHKIVRKVGFELLVDLCVEGKMVSDVWAEFAANGMAKSTAKVYVTQRLIEALDDLIGIWFQAEGKGGGGVRSHSEERPFDVAEFAAQRKSRGQGR